MKRFATLLSVLVLTLSLFTGCGCTPGGNNGATVPTRATVPMVPETNIPPTTMPTEAPTIPTESQEVPRETDGGMNATSSATEATADHMPTTGAKNMPGQGSRMR